MTTEREATRTIDKQVGLNLRLIRVSNGESQTKLGDLLGVTFQQVQKYEKGTNRLSSGKLAVLAAHYGVSLNQFFATGNPLQETPDATVPMLCTAKALRIAVMFDNLPLGRQKVVASLMEEFLPDVEIAAG